jgi:hypothetical protein
MSIRIRKLLGTFAVISLALIWTLLAMGVAQLPVVRASAVRETIYYVVAGLGWVLPAMPLIKWMAGPGNNDQNNSKSKLQIFDH